MSIAVLKGKWRDKDGLRGLVETNPRHVFIDGIIVRTSEPFSGYVNEIPYGETVRVFEGGKEYGFKKRTNNTVEVF